jgi:ELWxxDGT repeat protein
VHGRGLTQGWLVTAVAALLVMLAIGAPPTSAATKAVLAKDINPSGDSDPEYLTNIDGTLYFSADDGVHGRELWRSEGGKNGSKGTVLVKDINPGPGDSSPGGFTALNGAIYFIADDGIHGPELWKTDGTARGTVIVKDINAGPNGSNAGCCALIDATLYLAADDGVHGRELWKSDGTDSGTVLVKDIKPGPDGSYPHDLIDFDGTLFFGAALIGYDSTIWKSDGTASGTTPAIDIPPGELYTFNGRLFFNDEQSKGLWVSDGTEAGTVQLAPVFYPLSLINLNGTVFYFDADRSFSGDSGYCHWPEGIWDLWKTDGTVEGTSRVSDFNTPDPQTSCPDIPGGLTVLNGKLYFGADDSVNGKELWRSDGTEAGTELVKDINPGPDGSYLYGINVNGALFFVANDGNHGYQIWKSDGTAAGSVQVSDVRPGIDPRRYSWPTNVDGTLFFVTNDDGHGWELWKTKPRVHARH